jgi:mannosyltransferase OCH1-like enzyme
VDVNHQNQTNHQLIIHSKPSAVALANLPKLIHHTWKHVHLHPLLMRCVESFQKWNPEWQCLFWTDDDCERLIAEELPGFLDTYLGYPRGILRADIFRLVVLYLKGGVYADLDMECLRPLNAMVEAAECRSGPWEILLGRDHPSHERLHYDGKPMWLNAFMIARPGAKFLRLALDELTRRLNSGNFEAEDAVMSTGPGLLTRVIDLAGNDLGALGISELPWQWVHPLPNIYLQLPERAAYKRLIHTKKWRDGWQVAYDQNQIAQNGSVKCEPPFAAHYWWHSYIENCRQVNMLAKFGPQLQQTDGEIVERRLSVLDMRACPQSLGEALCAFAELGGRRILVTGAPLPAEVLNTLKLAGAGLGWEVIQGNAQKHELAPVGLWIDNQQDDLTESHNEEKATTSIVTQGLYLRLLGGKDIAVGRHLPPPGFRPFPSAYTVFEKYPRPHEEVPKTLHWLPPLVRSTLQNDAMHSWQELHTKPEWKWQTWTADELAQLIADKEPELLATYHGYPTDQHRILAARWVLLKHLGGIIVPNDGVCLRPLTELIKWKRLVLSSAVLTPSKKVRDEFLGSIVGHPFWNGLATHLEAMRFMPLDEAVGAGFLQQRCQAAVCLLEEQDWPILVGDDVLGVQLAGWDWRRLVHWRNWTALAQIAPGAWTLSFKQAARPVGYRLHQ